jgi:hypothetical protein
MRAGEARDLVRFERKGAVTGGYVKTSAAWSTLATVAAKIEADKIGKEEVIGDKVRGVSDFKITVRDCAALASLTTSDRAINARSGVIYDLRHVDRQTGRADVIISADAGTPTEGG